MKEQLKPIDVMKEAQGLPEVFKPKQLVNLHGIALRVAKLSGSYDWHVHSHEDELFYVLSGKMFIDTPEASVPLESGQALVVPRGIMHRSRVEQGEALVLLVEPVSTLTLGEKPEAS